MKRWLTAAAILFLPIALRSEITGISIPVAPSMIDSTNTATDNYTIRKATGLDRFEWVETGTGSGDALLSATQTWTGQNTYSNYTAFSSSVSFSTSVFMKGPGPWADVKAYGATGDGVTDDLVAVQNACNTGYNVFFPEGIYKLSNNIYPTKDGQTIAGVGRNSVLKIVHPTSNPQGIASSGYSNLVIRDLTIDGSGIVFDVAARGAIHLGDGTEARNCLIDNVHILNWQGVGILLSGAYQATVRNCYIYRSYEHSFYLAGSSRCVIEGNIVEGAGYNSGTSHLAMKVATFKESVIANNIILDSTSTAVQFQANSNGTVFANNKIIANGATGAQLLSVAVGEQDVTIEGNYLYRTDASAAMKAEGADRIKILNNTFDLPEGAGGMEAYSDALTNSIIKGNTFAGGGNAYAVGLYQASINNIIESNTFDDWAGGGIGIYLGPDTSSNTVASNTFDNVTTEIYDASGLNISQATTQNTFTINSSTFVVSAGKVGISSATPTYPLTVNGQMYTSSGIVFPDGTIQVTSATAGGGGGGDVYLASTQTFSGLNTFSKLITGSSMTLTATTDRVLTFSGAGPYQNYPILFNSYNGAPNTGNYWIAIDDNDLPGVPYAAFGFEYATNDPPVFAIDQNADGTPEATISGNIFSLVGGKIIIASTTFNGVDWTYPSSQGGAGTYLKNNGSGALSWDTPVGGSASTLAVTTGSATSFTGTISSPTAVLNFNADTFSGLGTNSTAYITLNPSSVTLLGASIDLSGAEVTGSLPAASIASGSLGAEVIASSITLSAMYGAPTLTGTNFTSLPGAQVGDGVPAANIAAGSLDSDVIASSIAVTAVGIPQINASGTPSDSTFLRGDGSWQAPAGSGDAVLSATQTWSGGNTFQSWSVQQGSFTVSSNTVISSTGTLPALKIVANGTYGTTPASSGGLFVDCSGGGAASGYCANIYSNAGAQLALGGLLNIKADNADFNEPLLYLVTDGTSGGATNIRMDGPAPQIEFIETDQTTPAGKYEIGTNGDLFYISGRNAADDSFENLVKFGREGVAGGGPYINLYSTGAFRFYDADSSNYVGFKASDTISADVTFVLPAADGSDGQFLKTDGAGVLSWETAAGTGDAVLADTQTWTGGNTFNSWSVFSGSITATNVSNTLGGDGAAITNLTAANVSAGSLDADVIASSLTVSAFWSDSTIRTNLGLAIGSDVQGFDATLSDLASAPLEEDNSIAVAAIAAGTLPSDVIASSLTVSAFWSDATIRSNLGLAIGSDVQGFDATLSDLASAPLGEADSVSVGAIAAGTLPDDVIASSITLASMYGAPTLTGTNFTSLPGAQVTDGVPSANIAAGSLDTDVIASSVAVNKILSTHMGNSDHGDVSWTSNVATVDNVAAANIASGNLGADVISLSTRSFTVSISSDASWDSEAYPIWQNGPKAVTIRSVRAAVMSGTSLTYNIEERSDGSITSAGTDIYSSDQAADTTGEIELSFSNASIDAFDHLVFTTGSSAASGEVSVFTVTVYYTIDP